MLFHSFEFLFLFLPVVVLVHHGLRRRAGARAARAWLLLASLFFYAYPRPQQLPLLLASIVVNWAIVRAMAGAKSASRRRVWLWAGLAANIAFLGAFKYAHFLLGQFSLVAGIEVPLPDWHSPLGISFFTLTQVMYLVDCFQDMETPMSLMDHASALAFFPYVSSGPLVRLGEMSRQFSAEHQDDRQSALARQGLFLLALGLAKKVVLADSFASVADAGFGNFPMSTLEAWIFSLSFTFQIYFDFSGYSDMAVGIAWMLGYRIAQNFNSPYIARSISEFWQRWHISLSHFITHYLYTPLLRSFHKATVRTSAIATLLAMGIAGLWHGPAWTYITFGLIHGVALVINQAWKRSGFRLPPGLGWLLTFLLVNAAFVVFNSRDLASAASMLYAMVPHGDLFGSTLLKTAIQSYSELVLRPTLVGVVLAFAFRSAWERALVFRPTTGAALATSTLFVLSFICINSSVTKRFVYFAF